MKREIIKLALQKYSTSRFCTSEEIPFLESFFSFIEENPDCFERYNKGHITGSAWILDAQGTHALLTHHKKLGIWVQLGGHADGEHDVQKVALKEAHEESGIPNLELMMPDIFDIDIHTLPTACELHFDVRYLLKAPIQCQFTISDESLDLAWVNLMEINTYSTERSVLRLAEKNLLL